MDDTAHRTDQQDDIDEQELKRRYYERLSDWSEPAAVKVYRGGKLVGPNGVLRKWKPRIPWARPKR
jgi:hypothetical protein